MTAWSALGKPIKPVMTAAAESRAEAWKAQRAEWLSEADNYTVAIAQSWFMGGWNARDAEVAALTAQLQAAQATIAEALSITDPEDTPEAHSRVLDQVWRLLSRADTSTHDVAILAARDDGWKRGYDASTEGKQRHSPYRASIEQTEAE